MKRPTSILVPVCAALTLSLGLLAGQPAMAQDTAPARASEKKADAKKKPAGRLPMYFAQVVDQAQREKIYAIQVEFDAKVRPLEEQVAALRKERDEKILAVLTPEQLKQLDDLKAAAKKSRDDKKAPSVKAPAKPAVKKTTAKKAEAPAEDPAK